MNARVVLMLLNLQGGNFARAEYVARNRLVNFYYRRSAMTLDEFQTERTRIISEMLDNPDKHGIYPTATCFNALDELFIRLTSEIKGPPSNSPAAPVQHSNGAESAEICPFAGTNHCTEGVLCSGKKGSCDKW